MKKIKPRNHEAIFYSFNRKKWQEVYHLIILPMYKEGIDIVKPTLQALAGSNYPPDKMIVVLAIEERVGEPAQN